MSGQNVHVGLLSDGRLLLLNLNIPLDLAMKNYKRVLKLFEVFITIVRSNSNHTLYMKKISLSHVLLRGQNSLWQYTFFVNNLKLDLLRTEQ